MHPSRPASASGPIAAATARASSMPAFLSWVNARYNFAVKRKSGLCETRRTQSRGMAGGGIR